MECPFSLQLSTWIAVEVFLLLLGFPPPGVVLHVADAGVRGFGGEIRERHVARGFAVDGVRERTQLPVNAVWRESRGNMASQTKSFLLYCVILCVWKFAKNWIPTYAVYSHHKIDTQFKFMYIHNLTCTNQLHVIYFKYQNFQHFETLLAVPQYTTV